jgi:hypothetical protein
MLAMSDQRQIQKVPSLRRGKDFHFLLPSHIRMIDEALSSLGEFGEVRLVVEKGRLRFLVTQKSYDTLKWQPGVIVRDVEP